MFSCVLHIGTVGHERYEVIFYVTNETISNPNEIDKEDWFEIIFKCKPGPLDRRPCLITPYHYRLDWQIWFAGFQPHTPNRHPWIFLFCAQLLNADYNSEILKLLDDSVYQFYNQDEKQTSKKKKKKKRKKKNNKQTKWIKADMYRYTFTKQFSDELWWNREYVSSYLPPLNLEHPQFNNILKQLHWVGLD